MSKHWQWQSGEGRAVGRKTEETSRLLGVGPVAGKSTVKEAIYLCKSLPVGDSPGGPEGQWLASRWRSDRNWLVY